MISPLLPTFAPAAPTLRVRERNPGNENFRDLVNSDRPDGEARSEANRAHTDNRTLPGDQADANADSTVPASMVSGNGLEAQTVDRSLLAGQTTGSPEPNIPAIAPLTTTEALQTALPAAAVRVVAAATTENVEVIAMPWHLQANGGLSYSVAGAKAQDVSPIMIQHVEAGIESNPFARSAAFNTGSNAGFAEKQVALVRSGTVSFVSDRVQRSAAMSAAADVAVPGRTGTALLLWPHRLLRWLADSDAGTTAWVRDYRLDASQATQLIDSLRCLAQQQGHPLHRIMLNGHELWRSPSTPDSN
jgi:hypothetical protein